MSSWETLELEEDEEAQAAVASPPGALAAGAAFPGVAERARASVASIGRHWHLWLVVGLVLLLAMPRLGNLLPAAGDHTDEIYQPNQALKFAATFGQSFHKYGPVPNFLLLPSYGVTFAWWKATGDFSSPSGDYPYGLARPVEQLGLLVLQSRVIFLLLGLVAIAGICWAVHGLTRSRLATAGAALLVIVTNFCFQWMLPRAGPDSAMLSFLLLSLAVWLRIAHAGATPRRAACFAALAALAVGSKENSAVILAAMAAALVVWCTFQTRGDAPARRGLWRSVATAAGVGVGLYLLMNVVYAPLVWWERVQYWAGSGVSGEVWGGSDSWRMHLRFVGSAVLNNLGPAGALALPVAALAAWWRHPRWAAMLSVPPLAGLGLVLTLPYAPDRFVTPATVVSMPLVALGISVLWCAVVPAGKVAVATALLGLVAVNLLWTTVIYHLDDLAEQALVERDLRSRPAPGVIAYGSMTADPPPLWRLEYLGYEVDGRPIDEWPGSGGLPDVVYITSGRLQMMEEARAMPERAEFYQHEKGFDVDRWSGFAALGYREPRKIEPPLPRRLRGFGWMPVIGELRHSTMLAFERE